MRLFYNRSALGSEKQNKIHKPKQACFASPVGTRLFRTLKNFTFDRSWRKY